MHILYSLILRSVSSEKASYFDYGRVEPDIKCLQNFRTAQLYLMRYIYTHTTPHTHTHALMRPHARIHARACTHTHTPTHTLSLSLSLSLSNYSLHKDQFQVIYKSNTL